MRAPKNWEISKILWAFNPTFTHYSHGLECRIELELCTDWLISIFLGTLCHPRNSGREKPVQADSWVSRMWTELLSTATGICLKPCPNAPPNSSQVHNFDGVGYRLARIGSSWLEIDQAQFEPGFPPFGHLSQLKPTLAKLSCYCYVTTRSNSDNSMVSCKLARLGGSVWPPADAIIYFVTWLELAELGVPFGHPPMQVRLL